MNTKMFVTYMMFLASAGAARGRIKRLKQPMMVYPGPIPTVKN